MTDFTEQIDLTIMNNAIICVAEAQQQYQGNNITTMNDTNELYNFAGDAEDEEDEEDDDGYDAYNDDAYVPKMQKRIFCSNCKSHFNTEAELEEHDAYLCWENTKSYDCKYCCEHFETLADFIRHDEELCIKMQMQELADTGYDEYHDDNYVPKESKRIYCFNCNKYFKTEAEFDSHETYICWEITNYYCKYCEVQFETHADFIGHDPDMCRKYIEEEYKQTRKEEKAQLKREHFAEKEWRWSRRML